MSHNRIDPAGMASALGGTCLWGLSFIIPVLMPGVSAFDVSIGRYLIYGSLGALLFARQNRYAARLPAGDLAHAMLFAITGYWGCYTVIVMAINAAGPAMPTLVMGLTPVTVPLVGNLRRREMPFSRLIGPVAVIGAGLFLANLARFGAGASGGDIGWGLFLSFAALALITHFLVSNLLFLKSRPHIAPVAWANAIGASVFVLTLIALAVRPFVFDTPIAEAAGPEPWRYFAGCAVLGLGSSWLGAVLWNRANALLPASVAGQCIVFWPVSGLIFAYLVQHRLPGLMEISGVCLVFVGIFWGLKAFASHARPEAAA